MGSWASLGVEEDVRSCDSSVGGAVDGIAERFVDSTVVSLMTGSLNEACVASVCT